MPRVHVAVVLTVLIAITSVAVASDFGAPISDAQLLNTNGAADTGTDRNCRLVHAGDGIWVAVWESNDSLGGTIGSDYDILYACSLDQGTSWSAPAPLNGDAATDSLVDVVPEVASDGSGIVVVVWTRVQEDGDIYFARSVDYGATWSAPAALSRYAAVDDWSDVDPVLAHGDGVWVCTWRSAEFWSGEGVTTFDVVFARSTDGGQSWSTGAYFDTQAELHPGTDEDPSLDTHDGIWVVAWRSTNALDGTVSDDDDILYSRSEDHGASWSDATSLDSDAIDGLQATDSDLMIRADQSGNWMVGWLRQFSIIVFRTSIDNAETWSAPFSPSNVVDPSVGPSLGVDEASNWVLVTATLDSLGGAIGGDADIVIYRSTDLGLTWTDAVPANSTAYGDSAGVADNYPVVAAGELGHWVIVWRVSGSDSPTGTDGDLLVATTSLGDCNGNGIDDAYDITQATSDDLNANGVPDECEPDCNDNRQIDDLDISAGMSFDCNGNGVPDECDIAGGESIDCNLDDIPDECQPDCDGDGIIDVCDDIGFDCNQNGMADLCDLIDAEFAIDDGVADISLGLATFDATTWANRFDAGDRAELSSIAVAFSSGGNTPLLIGDPVTLIVWEDPNDDDLPNDAIPVRVLESTVIVTAESNDDVVEPFSHYEIEPVSVTGLFFAGAAVGPTSFPAEFDQSGEEEGASWHSVGNDPSQFQNAVDTDENCGACDGKWMIRVNTNDVNNNGIPDDCEKKSNPADIAPPGGDGVVNAADLAELLAQWGACPPPEAGECIADIAPTSGGGDGIVNAADLAELLANWG